MRAKGRGGMRLFLSESSKNKKRRESERGGPPKTPAKGIVKKRRGLNWGD